MLSTMPAQATMASNQLRQSPSAPVAPPPSRWNVSLSGASVCPCLPPVRKMAPRQTRKPPSVTMNEGTPP